MSIYQVGNRVIDFRGLRSWTVGTQPGGDGTPMGGQTLDVAGYFHSLWKHAALGSDAHPGTSVGNWLHRMAQQAPNGGHDIGVCGSFHSPRQTPAPPYMHVVDDEVPYRHMNNYEFVWTGANQMDAMFWVPDNFESFQHDPDAITGFGAPSAQALFTALIQAWETNAPKVGRHYAIYNSFDHLAWTGRPGHQDEDVSALTPAHIATWINHSLTVYAPWFDLLVSRVQATYPSLDIRLYDVCRPLVLAMRDTAVGDVPITEMFEDYAPHGRATCYFVVAIAQYIHFFGEKPPANLQFNWPDQADPTRRVHAAVVNNYQSIVDYIWGVLRP
jgi:hypothetical protein